MIVEVGRSNSHGVGWQAGDQGSCSCNFSLQAAPMEQGREDDADDVGRQSLLPGGG